MLGRIAIAIVAISITSFIAVPPILAPSTVEAAKAKVVKATSVEEFYGSWIGKWRRLDNSADGDAVVNIRRGSSISPNVDFILNNGNLRFAMSPDFKDGVLQVRNGQLMKMDYRLMSDGRMHIKYKRKGNKGEYWLSRKEP